LLFYTFLARRWRIKGKKLQTPGSKLQKAPTSNTNQAASVLPLTEGWPGRNGFGAWSLEFIWILVLGAYLELEVRILELLAVLPSKLRSPHSPQLTPNSFLLNK
jgi:hypothetical protein